MTLLKDSQVLVIPGSYMGMPVVNYHGKKAALIAGGFVTERMLQMSPVDNGFGITEDELGNTCTVTENYKGPGIYRVQKYVYDQERAVDEKDFDGRSIDGVDVGPLIDQLKSS